MRVFFIQKNITNKNTISFLLVTASRKFPTYVPSLTLTSRTQLRESATCVRVHSWGRVEPVLALTSFYLQAERWKASGTRVLLSPGIGLKGISHARIIAKCELKLQLSNFLFSFYIPLILTFCVGCLR